jgi:hypothetical protein
MTLDDAIAALYVREINCGCETFWDGGIKVWIGDAVNGHHAETMFSRPHMGGAVASRRGGAAFPQGVSVDTGRLLASMGENSPRCTGRWPPAQLSSACRATSPPRPIRPRQRYPRLGEV